MVKKHYVVKPPSSGICWVTKGSVQSKKKKRFPIAVNRLGCTTYERLVGLLCFIRLFCWICVLVAVIPLLDLLRYEKSLVRAVAWLRHISSPFWFFCWSWIVGELVVEGGRACFSSVQSRRGNQLCSGAWVKTTRSDCGNRFDCSVYEGLAGLFY